MDPTKSSDHKTKEDNCRKYVLRNCVYFMNSNMHEPFFLLLSYIISLYICLVRGPPDITLEVEWSEGFTSPPDDVVRAALMSDGEEDGSVSDTDSE